MQGVHGADIGVSFSEHVLSLYSDELGALHRGDHVRFNATMQAMGDHHHLHHLHAWHLEKLPGHMDVEAHASSNGRYKVKYDHDHHHEESEEIRAAIKNKEPYIVTSNRAQKAQESIVESPSTVQTTSDAPGSTDADSESGGDETDEWELVSPDDDDEDLLLD